MSNSGNSYRNFWIWGFPRSRRWLWEFQLTNWTDPKCSLLGLIFGELEPQEALLLVLSFFRKDIIVRWVGIACIPPSPVRSLLSELIQHRLLAAWTTSVSLVITEKCFGFIRSHLENSQSQEMQHLLLWLTYKMTLSPFRNCADHYEEVYSSSGLDCHPAFGRKSFLVELRPCGPFAWPLRHLEDFVGENGQLISVATLQLSSSLHHHDAAVTRCRCCCDPGDAGILYPAVFQLTRESHAFARKLYHSWHLFL